MSHRFSVLLVASALLCGCSHAGSIARLSADYNKAIADVRNEQLLLNILRAAAREPLQFTAMGEINATVQRSAGIDTTLENLIAGGANAISHTIAGQASNEPVVSITPLSNKEFIGGMLRQTTPERLKQFMEFGWDAEFMLPLVVAEYQCPGGEVQKNSGEGAHGDTVRQALVNAASGITIDEAEVAGETETVTLDVADDKVLEMMRSGVAGGYTVASVTPSGKPQRSVVRLARPAKSRWIVKAPRLCSRAGAAEGLAFASDSGGSEGRAGYVKLRSVEEIIYFLGERLRSCYLNNQPTEYCALRYQKNGERVLFRLNSRGAKPHPVMIGTRFYQRNYWVSRLDSGDTDRTGKTLSFINQLIALQTDPSEIGITPRVLTIGTR